MGLRLGITLSSPGRFVGVGPDRGGMTTLTRAEIGALGEQLAVDHLMSLGLRVLARNWRCRYGELDVIAADKRAELHWMQHCDDDKNDFSRWSGRVRWVRIATGGPS
jgi:putative endonuclease